VLCDSNIVIYAAESTNNLCSPFVEDDAAVIASVTRIEVLGFPGFASMSFDRRDRLQRILSTLIEIDLDGPIIQGAIALRQQRRMRLADAVIAATALVRNLPLVTRNVADFKHIEAIQIVNPFVDVL